MSARLRSFWLYYRDGTAPPISLDNDLSGIALLLQLRNREPLYIQFRLMINKEADHLGIGHLGEVMHRPFSLKPLRRCERRNGMWIPAEHQRERSQVVTQVYHGLFCDTRVVSLDFLCYTPNMLTMPPRGTKAHLTARINARLLERLYEFAEQQGRTRSEIIDRAIEEYLDRHAQPDKPQPQQPPKRPRP